MVSKLGIGHEARTGLQAKVIELIRADKIPTYLSYFYKVSRNTVKSIVRRSKQYQPEPLLCKSGREHKLGPRCILRPQNYVKANNSQPLFVIAARFRTVDGTKLSQRTIRRYLHKNGVSSYVAASKPFLTTKHMETRLNWCTIRREWTMQQWSTVAFTDESSFKLRPLRNHTRVWRHLRKLYEAKTWCIHLNLDTYLFCSGDCFPFEEGAH